jgi:hypothetical protein
MARAPLFPTVTLPRGNSCLCRTAALGASVQRSVLPGSTGSLHQDIKAMLGLWAVRARP